MDLKIIVLDEFNEELGESKAISLIYEGRLDEFKEELDESDEEGSRSVAGVLNKFKENSTSRIAVVGLGWGPR